MPAICSKEDNIFVQMEKAWFEFGKDWLNVCTDIRDFSQQTMFRSIYDNPFLDMFLPKKPDCKEVLKERNKKQKADSRKDRQRWLKLIEKGGFTEGVIRMMLAIAREDNVLDEKEMKEASKIMQSQKQLKDIPVVKLKQIAKEQARILQTDQVKGMNALKKLLKSPEERDEAYRLAEKIAGSDSPITANERKMLDGFKKILSL